MPVRSFHAGVAAALLLGACGRTSTEPLDGELGGAALATGGAATGGLGAAGTGGPLASGGDAPMGGTAPLGGALPCLGHGGAEAARLPLGYCIDRTEVTRAEYELWLAALGPDRVVRQPPECEAWNQDLAPGAVCMASPSVCAGADCATHPVVCVDWCDAAAFCLAAGKRLCGRIGGGPTTFEPSASTSQWYGACSSGGIHLYPYGPEPIVGLCNDHDLGVNGTLPVASLEGCQSSVPGFTGILDLSGNVWEWEDACESASANAPCRVRGGSFAQAQSGVACGATGSQMERDTHHERVGFRCCSD